jgi:hypothetical protein
MALQHPGLALGAGPQALGQQIGRLRRHHGRRGQPGQHAGAQQQAEVARKHPAVALLGRGAALPVELAQGDQHQRQPEPQQRQQHRQAEQQRGAGHLAKHQPAGEGEHRQGAVAHAEQGQQGQRHPSRVCPGRNRAQAARPLSSSHPARA